MQRKYILFDTVFGSHLYGTDTSESDKDYKGVYILPLSDILLKRDKETYQMPTKKKEGTKNTKDDVDHTYIELRRFLYDAMNGQTYALDMLFSPKKYWTTHSSAWDFIVTHRNKLLSKNVQPYIGYCRQQAGKYGLKGSRLGDLMDAITFFEGKEKKVKISVYVPELPRLEHVYIEKKDHVHKDGKIVTEEFLNVLGKMFSVNTHVELLLVSLHSMNDEYGDRARLAQQNEGVDWKAISHAYRCCYQLKELATTGHITFPLQDREYLQLIKSGGVSYVHVQKELPILMQEAIDAFEQSSVLPEKPDTVFWDTFVVDVYTKRPELSIYSEITQDESLPKAVIVDIDGTLAKMNGRSPYDYSKVTTDTPVIGIREVVNLFYGADKDIVLCSGRPECSRMDTEAWLDNHGVLWNSLYMRKDGDDRRDDMINYEFLQDITKKYYVTHVLDDRDRVVAMWRACGLTCLQVNYGNF
jgi:predicted nucleotidyltransferase